MSPTSIAVVHEVLDSPRLILLSSCSPARLDKRDGPERSRAVGGRRIDVERLLEVLPKGVN